MHGYFWAASTTDSMSTIKDAMTSSMQQVQTDTTSMIAAALPYALGIAAISIILVIAWRVFKKFSKG